MKQFLSLFALVSVLSACATAEPPQPEFPYDPMMPPPMHGGMPVPYDPFDEPELVPVTPVPGLSDKDLSYRNYSLQYALEKGEIGNWRNPNNDTRGIIIPLTQGGADAKTCRVFQEELFVNGQHSETVKQACSDNAKGVWQVTGQLVMPDMPPPGVMPPGAVPFDGMPPGAFPPPPGAMPPGAFPPPGVAPEGSVPPGVMMPPPGFDPSMVPPGAVPPGQPVPPFPEE